MGCAVQLHESTTRCRTWAEHKTDVWYLGTSNDHYKCHRIYVKKTRSEQISDTVFFKHRYITQPTLMQVVTIAKALDDLTHALKGRKNVKGDAQIKALEKINELLNNISRRIKTKKEKQVTFDETTAPPQETNVRTMIPGTKQKTTA